MSRGQPDYAAQAPKEVAASVSDMGEIAARLGSIVTYDKRGDVVDLDDFEEPVLRWQTASGGTGSYVILDSFSVKSASQAVKLHSASEAYGTAGIGKDYSILASEVLGFEFSFSNLSDNIFLSTLFEVYDGTNLKIAGIRYDPNLDKLYIYDSTGGYVLFISDLPLVSSNFIFHTLKIVVDFSTGYYKRLLLDNVEYDISDIAIYPHGNTSAPMVYSYMGIANMAAIGGDVWIDDVILTQEEP